LKFVVLSCGLKSERMFK